MQRRLMIEVNINTHTHILLSGSLSVSPHNLAVGTKVCLSEYIGNLYIKHSYFNYSTYLSVKAWVGVCAYGQVRDVWTPLSPDHWFVFIVHIWGNNIGKL
jgi:hypothetical protein